jgi:predicted DNA-binding transcriptional regulator AlpA
MQQLKCAPTQIERRFVNEKELEAITGVSRRTWQKFRLFGTGPRYYRIGGAIRYDLAETMEYIKAQGQGGAAASLSQAS